MGVEAGLPLLLEDGEASYIYGPGGMLVEEVTGGKEYYYHPDQLGSVRALTDSEGGVTDTYNFDAYGNKLASSTGTTYNPFGYTGEYTDAESGLLYLRARYYDPATQQFLTVDPIVAWTEQAYAYVAGNPLYFTDPTGQYLTYSHAQAQRVYAVLEEALKELEDEKAARDWTMGSAGAVVYATFAAATIGTAGAAAVVGGVIAPILGAAHYKGQSDSEDLFGLDTSIAMVEFLMDQIETFDACQKSDHMTIWFEEKNGQHILRAHIDGQADYQNPLRKHVMANCKYCRGVYDYFYPIIGDAFTSKNTKK
jgi:RHS repeat-associated protein